jgi:hypothetical protein
VEPCTIVQTRDEGKALLEEIGEFIKGYGITSRVHTNGNKYNPKHAPCYRIDILGWDNSVLFMSYMIPYLRIKKTKAQDMIRYHKVFPYMPMKAVCMLRGESRRRNAQSRQSNDIARASSYN